MMFDTPTWPSHDIPRTPFGLSLSKPEHRTVRPSTSSGRTEFVEAACVPMNTAFFTDAGLRANIHGACRAAIHSSPRWRHDAHTAC